MNPSASRRLLNPCSLARHGEASKTSATKAGKPLFDARLQLFLCPKDRWKYAKTRISTDDQIESPKKNEGSECANVDTLKSPGQLELQALGALVPLIS